MGRRGRLVAVLAVAVVPLAVLLMPRTAGPAEAAAATRGPDSSMAGSTTFAAIGPTAIPASSVWEDIPAVPTDLRSNALRPDGWTSADAAGLPILPGLAQYPEVADGAIRHALRFTAPRTCPSHIYPARHDAGPYSCSTHPPMGLRVRFKASVDTSGFGPQAQVILVALKRYGLILADNGSAWYVTGAPHANWDDDQLHDFHGLHASDFEVVERGGLRSG